MLCGLDCGYFDSHAAAGEDRPEPAGQDISCETSSSDAFFGAIAASEQSSFACGIAAVETLFPCFFCDANVVHRSSGLKATAVGDASLWAGLLSNAATVSFRALITSSDVFDAGSWGRE